MTILYLTDFNLPEIVDQCKKLISKGCGVGIDHRNASKGTSDRFSKLMEKWNRK